MTSLESWCRTRAATPAGFSSFSRNRSSSSRRAVTRDSKAESPDAATPASSPALARPQRAPGREREDLGDLAERLSRLLAHEGEHALDVRR